MQKITPFLWLEDKAEEAMNFYISIVNDSKVLSVTRYGDVGPGPKGTMMLATFQLEGQEFMVMNGGPHENFTQAISLFVQCETQEEIDRLWEQLSEGGKKIKCGWLTDKYGVTWQITPRILGEMMKDPDVKKWDRVVEAIREMDNLVIDTLKRAYEQG